MRRANRGSAVFNLMANLAQTPANDQSFEPAIASNSVASKDLSESLAQIRKQVERELKYEEQSADCKQLTVLKPRAQ